VHLLCLLFYFKKNYYSMKKKLLTKKPLLLSHACSNYSIELCIKIYSQILSPRYSNSFNKSFPSIFFFYQIPWRKYLITKPNHIWLQYKNPPMAHPIIKVMISYVQIPWLINQVSKNWISGFIS